MKLAERRVSDTMNKIKQICTYDYMPPIGFVSDMMTNISNKRSIISLHTVTIDEQSLGWRKKETTLMINDFQSYLPMLMAKEYHEQINNEQQPTNIVVSNEADGV